MITDYRGGYLKALIDVQNIVNKHDLTFYQSKGRLTTYLCRSHFPKLISFFIRHINELITWGDYVEFKARQGGALEMLSEPQDLTVTRDHVEGYQQALKDIRSYFRTCENRVTKKRIEIIIKELMNTV